MVVFPGTAQKRVCFRKELPGAGHFVRKKAFYFGADIIFRGRYFQDTFRLVFGGRQSQVFMKFGWGISIFLMTVPAFFAQVSGAFSIYLLIQFMRGIPKELDEAALVDGCGYWKQFFLIIIPNSKPALFTVGIFSFIWSWDDFLNQLIYINSIGKYTVSLALRMFTDTYAKIPWGQIFAMSILSIVPCALIFACAQKYFVEGIVTTGLK
jgi:ABC-type glycerol-3-phosphate transport system permease component